MSAPLGLSHLNLPARDPAALRRWYVEKLGFRAHGRYLWSAGTLLVFIDGAPLESPALHFGFRVASVEEVHAWWTRLRSAGVDAAEIRQAEAYTSFFLRDPEGNRVEIFHDPEPMA